MEILETLLNVLKTITDPGVLIDILKHPEFHTRKLPVLLSLIATFCSIIILAFMLLFLRKTGKRELYETRLRTVLVGLISSLVISLLFFSVPATYFMSQRSCTKCHKEENNHARAMDFVHRNIACEDCHKEKGIIGNVSTFFKINGKMFSLALRSGEISFESCVSNTNCLDCHVDINNKVATRNRIRVKHSDFLKYYPNCNKCHVWKKEMERYISSIKIMQICGNCHDNRDASASCPVCHVPYGKGPQFPFDLTDYPKVRTKGKSPITTNTTEIILPDSKSFETTIP